MNEMDFNKPHIKTSALLIWIFATIAMVLYSFWIPVHPDEAYYWVWSRHVALSYFDGPPLTAWILAAITHLFGIHAWTIKLIAVSSVAISSLVIYRLSQLLFDDDVALKALVIFLLIPITQATNFITSLDPLLMLCWSLALLCFYYWLHKPSIKNSVILGLLLGLGLLAKYPMALFAISAFFTLLFSKHYRHYLFGYKPYLVVAIGVVCFIPVLVWNFQHHWVSFIFQLHHGAGNQHVSAHWLGVFLAGQLGAFNPIYFVALIILSLKYREDYKKFSVYFVALPLITVLLIFGFCGLFNKSEANWTMPAYISASILLAYFFDKKRFSVSYWLGIFLNIVIILVLKFPFLTPYHEAKLNPIVKFYGYKEVIQNLENDLPSTKLPIISDTYQDASELDFYLKNHPNVCIVTPTRHSEITMNCQQLQQHLSQHQSSILWLGPQSAYNTIKNKYHTCTIKAVSQYRFKDLNRQWLLAECHGKL